MGLVHSPHTYCTIRNVHIRTFKFKSFMNHTTAPANYGRIVWMNSIQLVWFLLLFALWFDFLLKQSNIDILRILFFCAPDSYTYHIIRETNHFWSLIIFAMFIRRYSLNYYFKSKVEEIDWTFCTLHYTIIRSRKVNT